MLVALPYFEAYRYRSPNQASRVRVSRVSSTGKRWVCIFPLWKTAHLRKAFEIGHRWRWGRHVCAEGYVVASDNVDGGGEDVYEKNEIISVVTTKKEDVRLVTIIDLFAHRLVTERQTRGRCVEKTGFPGQKEDIYCAPMRFMHWGRNTLEVLCFSPCESPLFFLLLDTRHTGRRGKKKHTLYTSCFGGSCTNSTAFIDAYFDACKLSKSFRECVVKAGGCKFLSGLRWRAKCVMVSASTTERRKLLLCSAKRAR